MKFLVKLILTGIFTFLLGMFWYFYAVAIVIVILNLFLKTRSFPSFSSGFLGFGGAWLLQAWMLSGDEAMMIHARISEFLGMSGGTLLLVIFVVGGFIGGFAALAGSTLRLVFSRKKKNQNPYH